MSSNLSSQNSSNLLTPKCSGIGYKALLPLKADKMISQRKEHSSIHIGYMPLGEPMSLTLVIAEVADMALGYKEFL